MEKYFPQTPFSGKKILLGVSGSVAAYKAIDLLRAFHKAGLRISVTLTEAGAKFVTPLSFRSLGAEEVYTSMFQLETDTLDENYDPFAHLTPSADADAFVIAPASATTLARIASGSADEILSAQALAYAGSLIIAPSMNPRMWMNPATQSNCETLRSRGHVLLEPDEGMVACNEKGRGKLTDLRRIYLESLKQLSPQDMAGKSVMITLGPTREDWDKVRFWSNHSTGTMGAALAISAWLRGAKVLAVAGPGVPWLPRAIERHDVVSANEMFRAAKDLWPLSDYGIFTAAVADFHPQAYQNNNGKFKKEGKESFQLGFEANPDILASLGQQKSDKQRVVGFAAEAVNMQESARQKLKRKNADLLVGNLIGQENSGFGSANNQVFVVDRTGKEENWPAMPKPDVAWRILDWLLRL